MVLDFSPNLRLIEMVLIKNVHIDFHGHRGQYRFSEIEALVTAAALRHIRKYQSTRSPDVPRRCPRSLGHQTSPGDPSPIPCGC